jgi:hypothetical protein
MVASPFAAGMLDGCGGLTQLREQLSAGQREGYESPGLAHHEPATLDSELETRAVLGRANRDRGTETAR